MLKNCLITIYIFLECNLEFVKSWVDHVGWYDILDDLGNDIEHAFPHVISSYDKRHRTEEL